MLHLLFLASGAAGLVYEVCWVRQLGDDFGNTVTSAALVTAIFMCGLGLGSWGVGGFADRRASRVGASRALLRAYGLAELTIAGLGAALAWSLPRLGGVSASITRYAPGAHGWLAPTAASTVERYALAILLVAPSTLLMGATLTFLVRFVLARDVRETGLRVGTLYGANTAGAALGALATDGALVPALGLFGAQLTAVAVNVAAGLGALALAAKRTKEEPPAPAQTASDAPPPESTWAPSLTLFLSGFAALGMEIVWFRLLSAANGAYRPVFSLLLATILVGIWLGATTAGYCHVRFHRALEPLVVAQALFAASALALMLTFRASQGAPYARALTDITWVVLLPSFAMGFSFPLVNALAHDRIGAVGRRAGSLYLANTFGSVAGSLVAGFVLAPHLGSQASFGVIAACAALAPLPLVVQAARRGGGVWLRRASVTAAALAGPVLAGWMALPDAWLLARFLPAPPQGSRVLDLREGPSEIVTVLEVPKGGRVLATNGHPMSGTTVPSQRYMRAFAHLPLLLEEAPKRALVICFGVGNTLHAAALHPSLEHLEIADLSRNVLEHAPFFAATNGDVLSDPRVTVYVDDGRQRVRVAPEGAYDLVTLEPPPIAFAGVSALYARELYELVRSRLVPGGFMTQWLPAYQVPPDATLSIVRAFVDVFPVSVLLSGQGGELILMGTSGSSIAVELDALERRLAARPRVAEDLARIRLGTLTELVGTFVSDADNLRRATRDAIPVTDDRPTMEYTFGRAAEIPASLFAVETLPRFCPACVRDGRVDPRVADLPVYMTTLSRIYASDAFRRGTHPLQIDARDGVAEEIQKSAYLRSIFGTPVTDARP